MTLEDVYPEVLEMISAMGARVEAPIECERFLSRAIEQYTGNREQLLEQIARDVKTWFHCLRARPRWIQEAEWQFHDDRPMIFLGQIDIVKGDNLFHDDASAFVFYSPTAGITKTVIQVA